MYFRRSILGNPLNSCTGKVSQTHVTTPFKAVYINSANAAAMDMTNDGEVTNDLPHNATDENGGVNNMVLFLSIIEENLSQNL